MLGRYLKNMPASDEYIPEDTLRSAILGSAIQPKIEELSLELGIDSTFSTVISVQSEDVAIFGLETSKWCVRLIVRNTFHHDRKNFQAHVSVEPDETSGFNGFYMFGSTLINEAKITVKQNRWTGIYNSPLPTKTKWR